MKLSRLFTQTQGRPYDGLEFERRSSRITNTNGTVVFEGGRATGARPGRVLRRAG